MIVSPPDRGVSFVSGPDLPQLDLLEINDQSHDAGAFTRKPITVRYEGQPTWGGLVSLHKTSVAILDQGLTDPQGRIDILGAGPGDTIMARAFLYAGTPSVLVSHWVVDELATRLLMEQFYQELLKSSEQAGIGTKAKALSKAQIFVKNLTFEALRDMLYRDDISIAEKDRQLQYLATSAGYGSIGNIRDDDCLFSHPYYWASFFLVGDQL